MGILNRVKIEWSDVLTSTQYFGEDGWGKKLADVINSLVRPDACVGYCEEGEEDTEIAILKDQISAWFDATRPRYELILDALNKEQLDLFGEVKVTSRNWFNDTPQTKNLNSENEDLTHLTSFGKGESLDPRGTPMARIDEVQQAYRNVLFDWTREFVGYFGLNRRE